MTQQGPDSEVLYGEGRPEAATGHPVVENAQEAFDKAEAEMMAMYAESPEAGKSVYDAHMEAYQKVLDQIPPEQQKSLNARYAELRKKVKGRVDDVSAKMIDGVLDNNPLAFAYRAVGKVRGVDVPTKQYSEMRQAKIKAASEVEAARMKQKVDNKEAFKKIVPGGKVLEIGDRIIGPSFKR